MPIQFSCKCGKRLQVKDELAGKRVRCPGCKEPITIPSVTKAPPSKKPKESVTAGPPARGRRAAAPPDSRVQKEAKARRPKRPAPPDDMDDDEDEEDEEERPRRGKKRKSKKRSNMPLLLAIGGGAAVVLVLVGVLLYLFVFSVDTGPIAKNNSGGNNGGNVNGGPNNNQGNNNGNGGNQNAKAEDHLNKIPPNADFMATVDIQGIKAKLPQQLVSTFLSKADGAGGSLEKDLGIPTSSVARATAYGSAGFVFDQRNNLPVVLMTSLTPVDSTKLQAKTPPDADGLILVNPFVKQYFGSLTDHTVAVGLKPDLLTLKQNTSQPNAACAKGITMARNGEHIAIAGRVPQGMVANLLQKIPPDQKQQFTFLTGLKDFTLAAKLDGAITVNGAVDFSDADAANQAKIQLDFWLNVVKNQLSQPPPLRTEIEKQLFNMVPPILKQIQMQQSGSQVTFTVTVPKSQVDSMIKLLEEEVAKMPNPTEMMTRNNLKQIGLAMHTHHDQYKTFPEPSFNKGLSWRVKLLPYIEQDNLYKQFNLNEPWNSPHNIKLLESMPKTYERPGATAKPGYTHFQVTVGPGGLFPAPNAKVNLTQIRDGTSNTFLVVEAKQPVPWTAPQDLQASNLQIGADPQSGKFIALFCDGAAIPLPLSTPMSTLRAYATPNGGEAVSR